MNANQQLQSNTHAKLHIPPTPLSIQPQSAAPPTLPLFGNVMMPTSSVCTGDLLCMCARCLIMKSSFLPKLPNYTAGTDLLEHSTIPLDSMSLNQLLRLSQVTLPVHASRITPPTSPTTTTTSLSPNSVHNLPFSTANLMKH